MRNSYIVADGQIVIINDTNYTTALECYEDSIAVRFEGTKVGVSVLPRPGMIIHFRHGGGPPAGDIFNYVQETHHLEMKYLVDIQLSSDSPELDWDNIASQFYDAQMNAIAELIVIKLHYMWVDETDSED